MSHKIKMSIFLAVAIAFAGLGFVFMRSVTFGFCEERDLFGCQTLLATVGQSFVTIFGATSLALLVLLFLHKDVFKAWLKAVPALMVVAFIWIAALPDLCGQIFCFDKSNASTISAVAILTLSLIIIIYKTIQLRRKAPSAQSQ